MGARALVEADDVVAGLIRLSPHVGAVPDFHVAEIENSKGVVRNELQELLGCHGDCLYLKGGAVAGRGKGTRLVKEHPKANGGPEERDSIRGRRARKLLKQNALR